MKISIALATYNGERWLREQLDSLARQTLLPCELVVSDDRSTDRTLEVVKEFAAASPFPVRVVRNNVRRGFADNFIHALRSCTGDATAYCDQDDVWNASKLERCAAAMLTDPRVTLVHHDSEEVDSDLRPLGILWRPNGNPIRTCPNRQDLVERVNFIGCCMLVRRGVVDALLNYWPEVQLQRVADPSARRAFCHDGATLRLAYSLGTIVYLPHPLIRHRRHQNNASECRISDEPRSLGHSSRVARLREYARLQQIAASMYAEMAERAEASGDSVVASYLARVARRDWNSARFYAGRAELYGATSRLGRMARFSTMVGDGAYGGAGGVLVGARSAAKDLMFALAGPSLPELLEALRDRLRLNLHPREVK